MIETSSLHKGIAGSKHQFVTLPSGRDKLDVLDDVGSSSSTDHTISAHQLIVSCHCVS
jgi:hypothetical protein